MKSEKYVGSVIKKAIDERNIPESLGEPRYSFTIE
jgi:hypothetical protein